MAELLESFGIENFEIYIGVLFDTGDNPATVQSDKTNGFYSSSKQGFEYLQNLVKQSSTIKIINEDTENLQMELNLSYSSLKVKIGALYGNDITFFEDKILPAGKNKTVYLADVIQVLCLAEA
ncbi:MAG: hypothetical protein QME07_01310 [bacterium]|nr:hypothetical protein [bacterium]